MYIHFSLLFSNNGIFLSSVPILVPQGPFFFVVLARLSNTILNKISDSGFSCMFFIDFRGTFPEFPHFG